MFTFDIILFSIILIISGLVYGVFGFGYAIISLALLPLFTSVKVAIPMVTVQAPVFTGFMLYGLRRNLELRSVLPLIVGLTIGLPLGVFLLRILSEENLRKILGLTILLYVLWSIYKSSPKTSLLHNDSWGLFAGVLSGIVGGAILAGGPIVVIYLSLRGLRKEKFKAIFLAWAMTICCILMPFYAISGILTSRIFLWALITLPFGALGTFLGTKVFKVMKESIFYQIIIVVLALLGIRLLCS